MGLFGHEDYCGLLLIQETRLVPFLMVTLSSQVFPCPGGCLDAELGPPSAHAVCPDALVVLWAAALAQGQGEPQAVCNVLASLPPIASLGRVLLPGGELVCTCTHAPTQQKL